MSRVRMVSVVVAAIVLIAAALPAPFSAMAWDAPAAKAGEGSSKRRVPAYFARLGLTGDQKTRIYEIQEEYDGRIDSLLAEVEELKIQRDSQVESVLSAGQRAELKSLIEQARIERIARDRETETAKKVYESVRKKSQKK